jgi:predicted PurR-regulated permease PerM
MNEDLKLARWMNPRTVSFLMMAGLLLLAPALHLTTPLLTILLSTFALRKFNFWGKRPLSVIIFVCAVCLISIGFFVFTRNAARALPRVAEESIPKVIQLADERNIELPFDDVSSLETLAKKELSERFGELTNFAKFATKELVVVILGLVIAVSIFLNPTLDIDPSMHPVKNNLYTAYCAEFAHRFRNFYQSFATVMGAQIVISSINTVFTAIFIFSVSMKHPLVLIGVTFLCGLLPIIGNILSNCVIVAVGFTMSPTMAIAALAFLVLLHKFEYFLNSKIIGDRIRNPVWLTMIGLIIGEKIMGIPGMILAPVILYYLKLELGQITAPAPSPVEAKPSAPLAA